MNREKAIQAGRFAGCAALLALLVVSSSAAGREPQAVGVPVAVYTVSNRALASPSMEETTKKLQEQRKQALALLQSVIDDPHAKKEQIAAALDKKTQIAERMEAEAAICAMLEHMGFGQTAAVMGEESLSIIAPWQLAENEHNRVRMIDAAASQSGLSAEAIKIILSKK